VAYCCCIVSTVFSDSESKIKQILGGKENLEVNYLSINFIFIDREILAYS